MNVSQLNMNKLWSPAKRVRGIEELTIVDIKNNFLPEIESYAGSEDKVIRCWGNYLLRKIEFYECRHIEMSHLVKREEIRLTKAELLEIESTEGAFITPQQYCKMLGTASSGTAWEKRKIAPYMHFTPNDIRISDGYVNDGYSEDFVPEPVE